MAGASKATSVRGALWLTSFTGVLSPVAGVVSAPILARALSVDGRGELAAALAPVAFVVAVATFGLPDALTYHLAKNPLWRRRALLVAASLSGLLGVLCLVLVYVLRGSLSGGDPVLARDIVIGASLAIPSLIVGAFRGAATGLQKWSLLSLDRVLSILLRVLLLVVLWLTGGLTVLTAILVTLLVPIVTGFVHFGMLRRHATDSVPSKDSVGWPLWPLMQFGSRVWLGSIANMVLAQSAQLLMVPLSNSRELGLYSVGTTIADVPLVVAMSIQGALFSLQSRSPSAEQIAKASRYTVALTVGGCFLMATTLPFWLGPLFGQEFVDARLPAVLLLLCSVVSVPGSIAAAALSGWGRPALRTIAVTVALVVFGVLLMILIPVAGALGAAAASVISTALLSMTLLVLVRRMSGMSVSRFLPLRGGDYLELVGEVLRVRDALARLLRLRST